MKLDITTFKRDNLSHNSHQELHTSCPSFKECKPKRKHKQLEQTNYTCFSNIAFRLDLFLVLTIFNEGAYLPFKSIFHKALNSFKFDCEITLESVSGTNQF